MQQEILRAAKRVTAGSRPSRRLRREGRVPGVVYGVDIDAVAVHVSKHDLSAVLNTEAGLNAIIELDVDGDTVLTVAREVQRHPARGEIDHLDFIQVSLDTEIEAEVQLGFVGIPIGVTEDGGIVQMLEPSVTISALPNAIPSSIEVDISGMALHATLTVSDLIEIEGVTYLHDGDYPLITVSLPAAEVAAVSSLLEGEEGEEGEEEEEVSSEGTEEDQG